MLRRKILAFTSAVAACAAFFCLPAAAADFTCPYISLPLTGDWAQQRMQPGSVPPNTFATLFASRKAGEGVLITVIPSDKAPKEAAQIMANNYKQQGMRVLGNPGSDPRTKCLSLYLCQYQQQDACDCVHFRKRQTPRQCLYSRQARNGRFSLAEGSNLQGRQALPEVLSL